MSGGSSSGGSPPWRPAPKEVKGNREDKDSSAEDGVSGGVGSDPCAIIETFNLASPNRAVLSGIKVGDTLDVIYDPGPPQRLIAEIPSGGGIAGSITFPFMLQVIKCIIHRQSIYVLDVVQIHGGACKVRIHLQ